MVPGLVTRSSRNSTVPPRDLGSKMWGPARLTRQCARLWKLQQGMPYISVSCLSKAARITGSAQSWCKPSLSEKRSWLGNTLQKRRTHHSVPCHTGLRHYAPQTQIMAALLLVGCSPQICVQPSNDRPQCWAAHCTSIHYPSQQP